MREQKLIDQITQLEAKIAVLEGKIEDSQDAHRRNHGHCKNCWSYTTQSQPPTRAWIIYQADIPKPISPTIPRWKISVHTLLDHLERNLDRWKGNSHPITKHDASNFLRLDQRAIQSLTAPLSSESITCPAPSGRKDFVGLLVHSQNYRSLRELAIQWADYCWATEYVGLLTCATAYPRNVQAFYTGMREYRSSTSLGQKEKDLTEKYLVALKRTVLWVFDLLVNKFRQGGWTELIFQVLFIPGTCPLWRPFGRDR